MKKKNKELIKENGEEMKSSSYDPQGSYTGNPVDGEKPVQDADDL